MKKILISFLLLQFMQTSAQAAVLFSTLPGVTPTPFAVSSQNFIDLNTTTQAADDFTVTGYGWVINQVTVQGEYQEFLAGGPMGPATSVNVYILGNSGSLPDSTNLSAASIFAAENISYTDLGSGDFRIPLPGNGLLLLPGTYWLVVQANMSVDAGGTWGWHESSSAPNSGTPVGFVSAWFQTDNTIPPANGGGFTCVNVWGARISGCDITIPADPTPPAEFDLAFEFDGTVLSPGVTVTPTTLTTYEDGSNSSFDVVLTAPPIGGNSVTIPIDSWDLSEGSVSTSMLVFNAATWDIPVKVFVTPGASGDGNDGDVMYTITNGPTSSGDLGYDGLAVDNISVTNINIEGVATIVINPVSGLIVDESGMILSMLNINATTPPTADVMINLSLDNPALATLSTLSVVLPMGSTAPQMITIAGVDNDIDDGNQAFSVITGVAVSMDPTYNGIDAPDVSAILLDNDTAGVMVTGGPLTTDEAGASDTFDVVLTSEPTANVTITLFSSDNSEATLAPTNLTFMPSDWDIPQTVTVTGENDMLVDGDIDYTIVLQPVSSVDTSYTDIDPDDVLAVNQDDGDTGIVPPIPTLSPVALAILILLMMVFSGWHYRTRS